jgi:prepilin-type N-terminal cleavage/methylation domain-containing protein
MQPLAREPRQYCPARGFTLLELMVVVVIIGIVVMGTILSLGATGRDSGLEQERDRLVALIAYTRERGQMLTLEYGIRFGQHGYRFTFYDNRLAQWGPERVDDTLRPRRLPQGLRFQLLIEGKEIVLDDKALQIAPVSAAPVAALSTGTTSGSSSAGAAPGTLSLANLPNVPGTTGAPGASNNLSAPGSSGTLNSTVSDDTPQLLLFSNGDTNSFALTIVREEAGRSATLQSSDDGTVQVGDIIEAKQ